MGFSWAFHLAHEAHKLIAKQAIPHALNIQDQEPLPVIVADSTTLKIVSRILKLSSLLVWLPMKWLKLPLLLKVLAFVLMA